MKINQFPYCVSPYLMSWIYESLNRQTPPLASGAEPVADRRHGEVRARGLWAPAHPEGGHRSKQPSQITAIWNKFITPTLNDSVYPIIWQRCGPSQEI